MKRNNNKPLWYGHNLYTYSPVGRHCGCLRKNQHRHVILWYPNRHCLYVRLERIEHMSCSHQLMDCRQIRVQLDRALKIIFNIRFFIYSKKNLNFLQKTLTSYFPYSSMEWSTNLSRYLCAQTMTYDLDFVQIKIEIFYQFCHIVRNCRSNVKDSYFVSAIPKISKINRNHISIEGVGQLFPSRLNPPFWWYK